jgi:hypothetical protein
MSYKLLDCLCKIIYMRLICFASLLFLFSHYSNAQTSFGIRFGTNLPSVSFEPSINQQAIITYNGGLIFEHFEEKHAGIQLEVNFSQKGWKEIIDSVHFYSRTINYIEIPFMSHFYVGSEKANVFLNLGPYVGYGIAAKQTVTAIDTVETSNYNFTGSDNRFDFGLLGGLGIKRQFGFGILQLEGRFSLGFSDITKSVNSTIVGTAKNQVISISVAYLTGYPFFKRKKKIA